MSLKEGEEAHECGARPFVSMNPMLTTISAKILLSPSNLYTALSRESN